MYHTWILWVYIYIYIYIYIHTYIMVLYKATNPPLTSHLVDLNQVFWFSNSKVKTSLRCKWDGSDVCLAPVGAIRGKCWFFGPPKRSYQYQGLISILGCFFGRSNFRAAIYDLCYLRICLRMGLGASETKRRYDIKFASKCMVSSLLPKILKNAHRFVYINSLIEHIHKYAIYLYRGYYQMNISPLCLSALKVLCRWGIFYALGASPTVEGED